MMEKIGQSLATGVSGEVGVYGGREDHLNYSAGNSDDITAKDGASGCGSEDCEGDTGFMRWTRPQHPLTSSSSALKSIREEEVVVRDRATDGEFNTKHRVLAALRNLWRKSRWWSYDGK